jgi:hypothetical protein
MYQNKLKAIDLRIKTLEIYNVRIFISCNEWGSFQKGSPNKSVIKPTTMTSLTVE